MTAIKAIQTISSNKKAKAVFPPFALRVEISQLTKNKGEALKSELNELVKSGQIKFGRTINDFYFYICE